jgi:L-asparagine oxygenase
MSDSIPYRPLKDPAAVHEVTPDDQRSIRAIATKLAALNGHLDATIRGRVRREAFRLSDDLVDVIEDFRLNSNPYGTLLLRGMPIGEVPPTPASGVGPDWPALACADTALAVVLSALGDPIAYADEKDGALIQDVIPVTGEEDQQENSGSVLLEFHTENGFHPHKPHYVGLLCLRQDHLGVAATATASIQRALPLLSGATIDCLRRPLFQIRLSSSFTRVGMAPRHCPAAPVLSGHPLQPQLTADFHATQPLTEEAALALSELRAVLEEITVGVVLAPGDLILVDNRAAIHARTAFVPRYDGRDRWLRRMSTVSDIRESSGARPLSSRVCSPFPLLHVPARALERSQ